VRSEHEVHPAAEVEVTIRTGDAVTAALFAREVVALRTLGKTKGDPTFGERGGPRPAGAVMNATADADVLVSLVGLVDGDKEAARVEREIKKVEKDLAAIEKKLALPSFTDKAPPEVVVEAKQQLEEMKRRRTALEEARGIATELGPKAS
jgi:valyl-tRNA synthetase